MIAAAVATLVGAVAATALLVAWTVVDDPCPDFASEGPMVAPASPYAQVMCEPAFTLAPDSMSQVEVPPALVVVLLVALAAGLVAALRSVRRPARSRRSVALGLAVALLLPSLLVVLAQHTLPRDCLGERAGGDDRDCARDREVR
ncbi:hypothetical protein NOK12_02980 [Nocardioides sp. OK12]|uniref:hypothetical protein n=1 Tax=Nocardioides sp. OK12 TaxID=2758661 RepID=UPI0021C4BB49|nr:hypothetical protein [Nocardioides sp. OK12]GHJ57779.1 hypothetical protein NOK12_02980 [Nocardioides sp. OK12]